MIDPMQYLNRQIGGMGQHQMAQTWDRTPAALNAQRGQGPPQSAWAYLAQQQAPPPPQRTTPQPLPEWMTYDRTPAAIAAASRRAPEIRAGLIERWKPKAYESAATWSPGVWGAGATAERTWAARPGASWRRY